MHTLLRQIIPFILFSEVLWAVKKYTVSHQEPALCRKSCYQSYFLTCMTGCAFTNWSNAFLFI